MAFLPSTSIHLLITFFSFYPWIRSAAAFPTLNGNPTFTTSSSVPKSHHPFIMSLNTKNGNNDDDTSSSALEQMNQLADEMNSSATTASPFTTTELDQIMSSLTEILPPDTPNNTPLDMPAIRSLVLEVGHLPHSDWDRTANSATRLGNLLLPEENGISSPFRYMFDRILTEGNWDGAVAAHTTTTSSNENENETPWAVLVTGLNGIRKTTSIYQPWFEKILQEAIVSPSTSTDNNGSSGQTSTSPSLQLPTGQNSFFRQLDHMIATLVNRHFLTLYQLTSQAHDFQTSSTTNPPPANLIATYSKLKASIFTRYRTLSEILGILLIREAQRVGSNVMLETSGRNVAMFHYIDEFFPADTYRKLVLRFTINEIKCAEGSVDVRMVKEMVNGGAVMKGEGDIDVRELIRTNLGGPYGSEVLLGVQQDSDNVWETNVVGEGATVGEDWYKACIEIRADAIDPDKDWTANAIKEDGSEGTSFTFEAPPSL